MGKTNYSKKTILTAIVALSPLMFAAASLAQSSSLSVQPKQDQKVKNPRGTYKHWALDIFKPYTYQKKSSQIPEPFVSIQEQSKGKANDMHLIHDGTAALFKRFEMIDRAKKSIELEYFILSPKKKKSDKDSSVFEKSTQILIQKLIQKAIDGVKVRILVDHSITIFQLNLSYVQAIKEEIQKRGGNPNLFEVRYYNNQISQFRSHRKLFVIDNEEAITGGRNIEDKYFNLDHSYNFHDRDVWVKGPIVPVMKASFEAFWNSPVVQKPDLANSKEVQKNISEARAFLKNSNYLQQLKSKIDSVGLANFNQTQTYTCPKTIFAADKPLTSVFNRYCMYDWMCKDGSYKESHRITERVMGEQIANLRSGDLLLIDTPYVMLNTRSGNSLKNLTEKNIELRLFTNSLASTDATYSASVFYREVYNLQKSGVRPFIHSAKWNNEMPVADEAVKSSRWGMHSKSHVYGNQGIFVGTYNVDNRSSFYNAEMGLFCLGSRELTEDLKENILSRQKTAANEVVGSGKAVDHNGSFVDPLAGSTEKQRKQMNILRVPTELFQFLM